MFWADSSVMHCARELQPRTINLMDGLDAVLPVKWAPPGVGLLLTTLGCTESKTISIACKATAHQIRHIKKIVEESRSQLINTPRMDVPTPILPSCKEAWSEREFLEEIQNSGDRDIGRVAIWHENDTTNGKSIGILEEDMESQMPFQRLVRGEQRKELDTTGISCFQGKISDICVMTRNVRINTGKMTLHLLPEELPPMHQIICPYAVKYNACLEGVTPVEVLATPNDGGPPCQVSHHVPAIVFSSSGFATNLFHDFNDILIPLFLTSRNFRSQLKFVVTDFQPRWVRKYTPILSQLSAYDPIDAANDGRVHCFPGAVVGLKYHKDFTCNVSEIPGGYSMQDFRRFLHGSFYLKEKTGVEDQKPTLVLISRTHSRQILNEDEVVRMAKEVGFHVTVASPQRVQNLQKFAQVVHACNVLVGVHGAGMANMLFLAEGAVLVQVVPLGLNWPSKYLYGEPSRAMGLHYLEYRAAYDESSLSETYSPDHQVIVDPDSTFLQGYMYARAIYLDGQNLRIDLSRFRETLLQAMHKVGPSTKRGGFRQSSQ